MREETKGWGDYKKLPEENPEFPLIRRLLLGADSVVQTPRLRAFETNERRVAKFSETRDPCFVGRNAAVLQYTQFAYTDEATRRRISNTATARVLFSGTLPEEECEVHHRDRENRTGCRMDRVAFMEEVWRVVQSYGIQSILKLGLNRPLMREVLDKLDECEGRLSEMLINSATDEGEANSPIKMTPQEDKGEVVYLSRAQKGTMRSKVVIDRINEMKMKLGSRVTLRKAGKTKVDSEISMKAKISAKRKRVEKAMDLGQGDDRLPGTDRMLTDIVMVPPILMAGIKTASYKTKKRDRTLTGVTLEMKILSQCGEYP